jgi:large subunit ribosomal protein L29
MAKNKKQDINSLSVEELNSKIAETQLHLKKLQFGHAVTPLDNPLAIRSTRKEIARMQTARRKQQLGF